MAEETRGICVRDVPAKAFIAAYAEHLKNSDKFECPIWADLVKTSVAKELAPYGDDWYYIRAASIARKVYLRPGLGVGQLRKWYGGNNSPGVRTGHFRKANAGIIRSPSPTRFFASEQDPSTKSVAPPPWHTQLIRYFSSAHGVGLAEAMK